MTDISIAFVYQPIMYLIYASMACTYWPVPMLTLPGALNMQAPARKFGCLCVQYDAIFICPYYCLPCKRLCYLQVNGSRSWATLDAQYTILDQKANLTVNFPSQIWHAAILGVFFREYFSGPVECFPVTPRCLCNEHYIYIHAVKRLIASRLLFYRPFWEYFSRSPKITPRMAFGPMLTWEYFSLGRESVSWAPSNFCVPSQQKCPACVATRRLF